MEEQGKKCESLHQLQPHKVATSPNLFTLTYAIGKKKNTFIDKIVKKTSTIDYLTVKPINFFIFFLQHPEVQKLDIVVSWN